MGRIRPPAAETVAEALAATPGATVTELADRAGLGVSTVGKALAGLEAGGRAGRRPGGRSQGRRLPDRWTAVASAAADTGGAGGTESTEAPTGPIERPSVLAPPLRHRREDRLGPGQLAGLVLDQLRAGDGQPVTAGALAKALDRSAGAVSNCLQRLASGGQVSMVTEAPRRYVGHG